MNKTDWGDVHRAVAARPTPQVSYGAPAPARLMQEIFAVGMTPSACDTAAIASRECPVPLPPPDRTLYGVGRNVAGHLYLAATVRLYGQQCFAHAMSPQAEPVDERATCERCASDDGKWATENLLVAPSP